MSVIDDLKPASSNDVIIYTPYYSRDRHKYLPFALSLYKLGSLTGQRIIQGGDAVDFVASWQTSRLPAEATICRLQFEASSDLAYEDSFPNSEFVDYLIDVVHAYKRQGMVDFPARFYRKLLSFL
ncbi:MAG: type IV pilus biogenesis protein EbsA [Cyanobacteria bacterium P01_H01_bin.15]